MKRHFRKSTILFSVILITLLMLSTATAVQVTRSNNINEKKPVEIKIDNNQKNLENKQNEYIEIIEEKTGLSIETILDKLAINDPETLFAGGILFLIMLIVLGIGFGALCSIFSLTAGILWSWPIFGAWRVSQEMIGRALSNQPALTEEEKMRIFVLNSNPIGAFIAGFCAVLMLMD
jgi:hypothetical protein